MDASVPVSVPLLESRLPNMISTTEIFPAAVDQDAERAKWRTATFGEVFAPPPNMPQLTPPKRTNKLNTRGNTISFVQQEDLPKVDSKGPKIYPTEELPTGQWLGYGGIDMGKDPTSPTSKQKNRQRALSSGESQLAQSEATQMAVQLAKDDALFRRAYSSFAPHKDDSGAIFPEETKRRVWWHKVGEELFDKTFVIDPALLGPEDTTPAQKQQDDADEMEQFRKGRRRLY